MLFDVVVIGAGIVGAACAHELSGLGLRVALCDAGIMGSGATAEGMGHLAVMDDSDAQFALTRFSQRLWQELAVNLTESAEYTASGAIWVAADEEEMAAVASKCRYYSDRSVPAEILDSQQLAEAEPYLRGGLAGGLLLREDAVCYPPAAAVHLVREALQRGAKWFPDTRVVTARKGEVTTSKNDRISAGSVVVATGVDAIHLVPGIPVVPRKGHLVITDRHPGFVRHQLIELGYLKSAHATESDSVAFNVQPRSTGQVLIGSSRQFGVTDRALDAPMLNAMVSRAAEYMPEITNLSAIRAWTGFRAATPDKLPLVGRWPDDDRLFLATGHEGLGISTSLATARLIADELLGRNSAIPREPYCPARSFAAHA